MIQALQILTYVAIAGVFLILLVGVVNLARTDPDQPSRSNKLMRARVIGQFIVVVMICLLGWAMGAFS